MKVHNITKAKKCGFVALRLFGNIYVMSNYNRATKGYRHYLFSLVKGYLEDSKQ